MDTMTRSSVTGQVAAGEFVREDDAEQRRPGTYITIRLDDIDAAIVGGRVSVTYLPDKK